MSPEEDEEKPKRPMTLAEAGRRGGEKVKKERGIGFYAEIGRKGGRRVAESHGPEFYAEIGRKGGEARRQPDAPTKPDAGMDEADETGRPPTTSEETPGKPRRRA